MLTDRRDVQIIPRREHGLYMFRPEDPFDLRGTTNERIRVKHLVVDLIGSDDPLGDWQNATAAGGKGVSVQLRSDAGVNSC